MVNSRIASGDKLFLVDQEPVLNYATDMYDNLHPSVAGAPKMSTPWYNELVTLLPRCRASNPIIVSPATQNLTAGQPWNLLPDVLGHPSGTFSLSGKPSGMTIHPQTGEIRWPSPVAGTYHVTLNVNNGTGSDSLQFTLAVGAP
ncbi:MAG: hypothetical protein IPM37_08405 [Hahellaceae bacterium]|nr:hypothetical protein [Hahellaceae bacterium]